MFSRIFNRDSSVSSSYGTEDLSQSRESSSESSCFRDSDSTQRASSVYSRYRECGPAHFDFKIPRVWTSETGALLNERPSDVSSSTDEKNNLSSSNRSSLSSLTEETGDFDNIDTDDIYGLEEDEMPNCHREETEVCTPATDILTPETTSGQASPSRFSPVNSMTRNFQSFSRLKLV